MKLYGIAIAAVPQNGNEHLIHLTCTPIAVSDDNPKAFETLDNFVFKTKFDSTNTEQIADSFIKVSKLIDKVIKLQKASLKTLPYRPVALEIGEDRRRPVNGEALYVHLFGKRAHRPLETEEDIQAAAEKKIIEELKCGEPEALGEKLVQTCKQDKVRFKSYMDKIAEQIRHKEAGIALAENTRLDVSTLEHYPAFKRACYNLSKSLDQCSIRWGSFGTRGKETGPVQEPLDRRLIQIKGALNRKEPGAHEALIEVAENQGGIAAQGNSNTFIMGCSIPGYAKDNAEGEELRNTYPRFSFYYLHPDYEAAFHRVYEKTRKKNCDYTRWMQLPLDTPRPFFTSPCAWMVNDQLEIARGVRPPEKFEDDAEGRKNIIDGAREVAQEKMSNTAGEKRWRTHTHTTTEKTQVHR